LIVSVPRDESMLFAIPKILFNEGLCKNTENVAGSVEFVVQVKVMLPPEVTCPVGALTVIA